MHFRCCYHTLSLLAQLLLLLRAGGNGCFVLGAGRIPAGNLARCAWLLPQHVPACLTLGVGAAHRRPGHEVHAHGGGHPARCPMVLGQQGALPLGLSARAAAGGRPTGQCGGPADRRHAGEGCRACTCPFCRTPGRLRTCLAHVQPSSRLPIAMNALIDLPLASPPFLPYVYSSLLALRVVLAGVPCGSAHAAGSCALSPLRLRRHDC